MLEISYGSSNYTTDKSKCGFSLFPHKTSPHTRDGLHTCPITLKFIPHAAARASLLTQKLNHFTHAPYYLKLFNGFSFLSKEHLNTLSWLIRPNIIWSIAHLGLHPSHSLTALYPPSSACFLQWQLVLHWPRERSATCWNPGP